MDKILETNLFLLWLVSDLGSQYEKPKPAKHGLWGATNFARSSRREWSKNSPPIMGWRRSGGRFRRGAMSSVCFTATSAMRSGSTIGATVRATKRSNSEQFAEHPPKKSRNGLSHADTHRNSDLMDTLF